MSTNKVTGLKVTDLSAVRAARQRQDESPGEVHLPGGIPSLWFGNLELRLAANAADLEAVQALRYRIFYEEMAANASRETVASERDADRFDQICDHILVVDHKLGSGKQAVVGTYRLLRSSVALAHDGFYSAAEFDIGCLANIPGEQLELGRSCVDPRYRNRPTMQLLWRGIAYYVLGHDISFMFGCASLPGTDLERLARSLSYLYHFHLAPPALRPRALDGLYQEMNICAVDALDKRTALADLPPLIKGYLRVGAYVGDGAVIDYQFNTTDVCVVIKTDLVAEKYSKHYIRAFKDSLDDYGEDGGEGGDEHGDGERR
ncbi:MAG: GNAT family N-acetyltransferase [Alphaproteobacteria bacterium]|nr:GNAT family N-acetyltransferase [Alphaproteobacteria bacterium]